MWIGSGMQNKWFVCLCLVIYLLHELRLMLLFALLLYLWHCGTGLNEKVKITLEQIMITDHVLISKILLYYMLYVFHPQGKLQSDGQGQEDEECAAHGYWTEVTMVCWIFGAASSVILALTSFNISVSLRRIVRGLLKSSKVAAKAATFDRLFQNLVE